MDTPLFLNSSDRALQTEGDPGVRDRTFVTLDALRGVAALAVVTFHFREYFFQYTSHGYLAVDFFYMLSGFVLSYAYQQRLDAGWKSAAFLRARLFRLYPMYFAGLVGGVAIALVLRHAQLLTMRSSAVIVALVTSLFLLPFPGVQADPTLSLFPFDFPAWSLFFESLANGVHALALRRRSVPVLSAVVAFAFVGLLLAHHHTGRLDFGVNRQDLRWGLFRVLLSYCGGMLLHRLWQAGTWRWKAPLLVPPLLLLVVLFVPATIPHVTTFDLFAITFVFPLLLLLGASVEPGPAWHSTCKVLGQLSYPVYVLHVPAAEGLRYVMPSLIAHGLRLRAPWSGLLLLALVCLASLGLERWYDLPLRKWLRRRSERFQASPR